MFGVCISYSNHNIHYNERIWLVWWQDQSEVEFKYDIVQLVTCLVKYIPTQVEFLATFVYSFNLKGGRVDLQDHLRYINPGVQSIQIVLGNFNAVRDVTNRLGGNVVSQVDLVDFLECIEDCQLEQINNNGEKYTQNDRQDHKIFLNWIVYLWMENGWTQCLL